MNLHAGFFLAAVLADTVGGSQKGKDSVEKSLQRKPSSEFGDCNDPSLLCKCLIKEGQVSKTKQPTTIKQHCNLNVRQLTQQIAHFQFEWPK